MRSTRRVKKILIIFIIAYIFLFTNCIKKDPLDGIRKLARSSDIQKKQEAARDYQLAIDTLVKAYASSGSLNKAVGEKLMFQKNYQNAIKHLEIARDIRNEDANVYYWLGVCYVNLYKIENNSSYIIKAEKNYKIALKLMPDHMDILYSYAHLLIYGKQDYKNGIQVLKKYIYELNPKKITPDPKAFFLLGRS